MRRAGKLVRHDGPEHVFVFAPTRSGKGIGIVMPTLFGWGHSALIYDIKKELWSLTAGYRRKFSYCWRFEPTSADSVRFNPLFEIRRGDSEVRDAQVIADILVDPNGAGAKWDHWQTTAPSYREPARPIRAQPVSDVHVLAQSMVHFAERRRLLVFADNRQDATFQAGWMQDHARRYRLRSLMFERVTRGPVSIGDLAGHLDDLLERDDYLSRALIPEVWRVERKEVAGVLHAIERRRFLQAQVLREVATGPRQRIGLGPWGRMIVAKPAMELSPAERGVYELIARRYLAQFYPPFESTRPRSSSRR